jgi:hypothetical protein
LKKGDPYWSAILQIELRIKLLHFPKYGSFLIFFVGLDIVSCEKNFMIFGLAKGAHYGPGIVLLFRIPGGMGPLQREANTGRKPWQIPIVGSPACDCSDIREGCGDMTRSENGHRSLMKSPDLHYLNGVLWEVLSVFS